MMQYLCT